jgi:hypothetical protein
VAEVIGSHEHDAGKESSGSPFQKGFSRRRFIAGAATAGTVTAVGAMLPAAGLGRNAGPAAGSAQSTVASAEAGMGGDAPNTSGEIVAHVRDARTGQIDLYVGTRQISYTDRELAARLARAAS